jgi:DNA helicase-2/ATP-dependent DNA helicase PcrA
MMRLQVGIYGLAARHELEYEPDRGLVRYIGENNPEQRQLSVNLSEEELNTARQVVINAGRQIKNRVFNLGPLSADRCENCDHRVICSLCRR